MSLSPGEERLCRPVLPDATGGRLPLQPGADPEVTLEALIDAAGMLQENLRASWRSCARSRPAERR